MDQYKISTTTDSCSTMHKLASTSITMDCFEFDEELEDLVYDAEKFIVSGDITYKVGELSKYFIEELEKIRLKYQETKDIRYWRALIQLLPESWLQMRTWTANYEVLRSIYTYRRRHKLKEWDKIIEWIESLPYAKELICYGIN